MTEPFTWDVPADFNFARDVIDRLAQEDRLGLVFVDTAGSRSEYTFAQIADASKRWAAVLRDAGVNKGDRVVVVLPKIPDWLFCMTALLRIGAAAVPSAEQLRAKDLLYRANHSAAVAVVAHGSNAAEFDAMRADAATVKTYLLAGGERDGWIATDALLAQAAPWDGEPTRADDLAYIVYTSGTTKDPKGVVHSVAYTFAKRMQAAVWFDVKRDDLVWCTAGTGWAKSLWNVLLGPWSCGAPIVLHEGGFVPEERMNMIRDLGVNVLCSAPTEYRLLAKLPDLGERWKLPKLRHCVSAGEPLNPEVIELWKAAFGLTILDGYGQRTRCSSRIARGSTCVRVRWASRRRVTRSRSSTSTERRASRATSATSHCAATRRRCSAATTRTTKRRRTRAAANGT
jgi:acyl-coenzyme A synthetase/AMP-(fatty) acid ligase